VNNNGDYAAFLACKTQLGGNHGFAPLWMPDWLYPFQQHLVEWALRKGRAAIFADCGLGKTPMQLVWAENVARKTGRPVLMLTPLAVAQQAVREGQKFGIEVGVSRDGKPAGPITAINYERLHKADRDDYAGAVCDESSILKHWSGKTQRAVTRFVSKMKYRLLCTATPAPNDFVELGTSSEALGYLTHSGMLERFFRQISDDEKKKKATASDIIHSKRLSWRVIQSIGQWALKAHAFEPFWKWVSSWARACRNPSDLGPYDDSDFELPPLNRTDHMITPRKPPPGYLFTIPAFGLNQERSERRRTIEERAELVGELANHNDPAIVWCQLNDEADAMTAAIPGAVQVKGTQSIDQKEELLMAFLDGQARVLVTKAKIAGLGLNMQHCNHVITFVTHSYEQFYQSIRRCWRFGQERPVRLDVIATEGEINVKANMDRKERLAAQMFESIVAFMNDSQDVGEQVPTISMEVPQWMSSTV
jgi:superfamily II DNA or RNA helicase